MVAQTKHHPLQSCRNQTTDQTLPKAPSGTDTGQPDTKYPAEEESERRQLRNIVYDIVYDIIYDIVYDIIYDIVYDVVRVYTMSQVYLRCCTWPC